MKFLREIFKMIKDPDGLLNVLGLILLCMVVVGIILIVAIGLAILKIIKIYYII